MHIVPLGEHPHHVDTVTRWVWDEWGGSNGAHTFDQVRSVLAGRPDCPPTLVAVETAEPLGVVGFRRVMFRGREPLRLFINALFVQPAYRGRGVGSALLRAALGRVGPEDSAVHVYASLREWYQNRGFVVVEEEPETGNAILQARCPHDPL